MHVKRLELRGRRFTCTGFPTARARHCFINVLDSILTQSYPVIPSHTQLYPVIPSHTQSYPVVPSYTQSYPFIPSHTQSTGSRDVHRSSCRYAGRDAFPVLSEADCPNPDSNQNSTCRIQAHLLQGQTYRGQMQATTPFANDFEGYPKVSK